MKRTVAKLARMPSGPTYETGDDTIAIGDLARVPGSGSGTVAVPSIWNIHGSGPSSRTARYGYGPVHHRWYGCRDHAAFVPGR